MMQIYVNQSSAAPIENESLSSPSPMFVELLTGGSSSDSGIRITQTNAVGCPSVWTSATKICGHIGQMPLEVMRWVDRESETSKQDINHASHWLLNYQFSDDVSACVGKETIALHALLRGNGRALIVRNDRFEASELIILDPKETVTVTVREKGNPRKKKWHVWRDPDTGKQHPFPDSDVFHIPGLTNDGMNGYDTIEVAGNSIGLNLVAEKKMNRYIKNDAVPSLILEAPAGQFAKEDEARKFLNAFRDAHSGDNQGTVGMLRNGVVAKTISQTAQESQMIEQRKFSREDMALLFGVEQMLGIDKSVSYNSEEQRSKAYRVNCLGRWMTRWTQECQRKLLSKRQQRADSHFYQFNDEVLLQATLAERYEAYSKAITSRFINPNEVRKKEGYKPYSGGDEFVNPNTTSGNAPPVKEPAKTASPPAKQQASNAVRSHIEHIVNVEKKRLLQYSEVKNYIAAIDRFYEGWAKTITNVVQELGGDAALAAEWIEQSKSEAIRAADVEASELKNSVQATIGGWGARIETFIERISEVSQ